MLNLFTPLFRINNLRKVYDSIPKHDDIHWIIVTCEENNFDLFEYERTPNITIIKLKTPEGIENIHLKTNAALKILKDGFYFGLDDDTTFNPNTYELYKKYKYTHKMIIGKQLHIHKGKVQIRLNETIPECCKIDGAQALIHTSIAKQIPIGSLAKSHCADGLWLLDLWNACKPNERILVPEVISNYNFLR